MKSKSLEGPSAIYMCNRFIPTSSDGLFVDYLNYDLRV